jgi:hypothetical protein
MENGEMILYTSEDGNLTVRLRADEGTIWLTQAEIASLFQTTPQNITLHVKTIYEEGELDAISTCKESLQVRIEGDREIQRNLKLYNLNMILAIGYRVRTHRGIQFRQWATVHLQEYLVKGFVMDDARLKEPNGRDYFDELLERIREIRASEKRFYQKVRDIYSTAIDYDPKADHAQLFFKKVQNKMLWAISGQTAAELIAERANPQLPNMGLMNWKGSRVRKQDVTIAKNYLNQPEIAELNRIVVMYLDYAEDQAKRRSALTMMEWEQKLDTFLTFNERALLDHAGTISALVSEKLAQDRYEEFDDKRRHEEKRIADDEDIRLLEKLQERAELSKSTNCQSSPEKVEKDLV